MWWNAPQWTLWAVGIVLSVVERSTVDTLGCWHCPQCGGTLHSGHFGLLALSSVWWDPPQWTLWAVECGRTLPGKASTVEDPTTLMTIPTAQSVVVWWDPPQWTLWAVGVVLNVVEPFTGDTFSAAEYPPYWTLTGLLPYINLMASLHSGDNYYT